MLVVALATSLAEASAEFEWTRQLGTASYDGGTAVAADNWGNAYITGWTEGDLVAASAGTGDTFLAKYDGSGSLLWQRQLGTSDYEFNQEVASDWLGNAYTSGDTYGRFGGASAGNTDLFLAKYDDDGNQEWIRQLGSAGNDYNGGIVADALGQVYVTGWTEGDFAGPSFGGQDVIVAKYSAAGNPQWRLQLGTSSHESGLGIAADNVGNVYISGVTNGELAGTSASVPGAFLAKYDGLANQVWIRQLGTGMGDVTVATAVTTDGLGNVYISGYTWGLLGQASYGDSDAFVAKYDVTGSLQWIRQFGTNGYDTSESISADALGNIFVAGTAGGSFSGGPTLIVPDAFVVQYDAAGNLLHVSQFGSNTHDSAHGVAADGFGRAYVAGLTYGDLAGNLGNSDAFLVKINAIPEPQSIGLLSVAGIVSLLSLERRYYSAPTKPTSDTVLCRY